MMTLAALARAIGAEYRGKDIPLPEVSIDSRNIKPGEMFVALKGPNFDGAQFVDEVIKKGAGALMVNRAVDADIPQIIVADTRLGLGHLGSAWRKQFKIPVIALTGSCGKTSTKEMIAAILREKGPAIATQGNLNNDFGVPLTLLRLRPEHEFAVIEMGTNSVGEIAYLTKIAQTTAALITNIGASHLQGLGGYEGVSREKSDIFLGLSGRGIAVINNDEAFSQSWKAKIDTSHQVSYGIYNRSDVMAENPHSGPDGISFTLKTPIGNREVAVPLLGEHIVFNALAAVATTLSVGVGLEHVARGLAGVKPVDGRFKPYKLPNGALLIDDTYNASANAVKNAMKTLGKYNGKRIFVMSNMGEMGEFAQQVHSDMGHWAVEFNLDHLFLAGNSPELLQATLAACDQRAEYFTDKAALTARLLPLLGANTMVVVKGSRGNKMEEVVAALLKAAGIQYETHHH